MDRDPPRPPATIPKTLVDELRECDATTLEAAGEFARELSEYRESEQDADDDRSEDETQERTREDRPAEVPSKATITVKEINDNRYYYWQWRAGDTVTSKYKGPVNPNE